MPNYTWNFTISIMYREKHSIYRVLFYLLFQISTGSLGIYPSQIKGDYLCYLFCIGYFSLKLHHLTSNKICLKDFFTISTQHMKNRWVENCLLVWVIVTVCFRFLFLKSLVHSIFEVQLFYLSTLRAS